MWVGFTRETIGRSHAILYLIPVYLIDRFFLCSCLPLFANPTTGRTIVYMFKVTCYKIKYKIKYKTTNYINKKELLQW